jgi:hypothetical protein
MYHKTINIMKNIENLNLTELSMEEMESIDGGWVGGLWKAFLEGALIESAIELAKSTYDVLANSGYEMPEWQKHKMGGL